MSFTRPIDDFQDRLISYFRKEKHPIEILENVLRVSDAHALLSRIFDKFGHMGEKENEQYTKELIEGLQKNGKLDTEWIFKRVKFIADSLLDEEGKLLRIFLQAFCENLYKSSSAGFNDAVKLETLLYGDPKDINRKEKIDKVANMIIGGIGLLICQCIANAISNLKRIDESYGNYPYLVSGRDMDGAVVLDSLPKIFEKYNKKQYDHYCKPYDLLSKFTRYLNSQVIILGETINKINGKIGVPNKNNVLVILRDQLNARIRIMNAEAALLKIPFDGVEEYIEENRKKTVDLILFEKDRLVSKIERLEEKISTDPTVADMYATISNLFTDVSKKLAAELPDFSDKLPEMLEDDTLLVGKLARLVDEKKKLMNIVTAIKITNLQMDTVVLEQIDRSIRQIETAEKSIREVHENVKYMGRTQREIIRIVQYVEELKANINVMDILINAVNESVYKEKLIINFFETQIIKLEELLCKIPCNNDVEMQKNINLRLSIKALLKKITNTYEAESFAVLCFSLENQLKEEIARAICAINNKSAPAQGKFTEDSVRAEMSQITDGFRKKLDSCKDVDVMCRLFDTFNNSFTLFSSQKIRESVKSAAAAVAAEDSLYDQDDQAARYL